MKKQALVIDIEVVIMAVFAYILSLIPLQLGSIDISLGMIPIIVLSLRRGLSPALASGLLWGILKLITGSSQILSPAQGFIEYIIAFLCAGLAGLFYHSFQKTKHPFKVIVLASLTGCVSRFFWHFIAGGIFWSDYAPKSINPWIFSFIINMGSAVLTTVVAVIVCLCLYHMAPSLFLKQKKS